MPIYEDNASVIWLGTGGGVSRYDARLPDGYPVHTSIVSRSGRNAAKLARKNTLLLNFTANTARNH